MTWYVFEFNLRVALFIFIPLICRELQVSVACIQYILLLTVIRSESYREAQALLMRELIVTVEVAILD